MTIEELKAEKEITIQAIKDAVSKFHEKTGTTIKGIKYDTKTAKTGYNEYVLSYDIDINVGL